MSQPPPRRVLVDLDNIEFYRPQPSKSLRLGPPRSILPTLPPLSHLPVTADCDPSQGDGFPFPDHPYSENSACGAAPLNSFDVELAKFAAAEPQLMDSRTQNNLAQEGDGNTTLGTAEFSAALPRSDEGADVASSSEDTIIRQSIEFPAEAEASTPIPPVLRDDDSTLPVDYNDIAYRSPVRGSCADIISDDAPVPELDIQSSTPRDHHSSDSWSPSSARHRESHGTNFCGIPSRHTLYNEAAKSTEEQGHDRDGVKTSETLDHLGSGLQEPQQNVSASASIGVAPLRDEKRLPSIAVVVPLPPRRKPSVVAQRQASKRQNQQCDVDDGSQHYSQSSELEPREPPRRSKRQRIMTRSMRKSSENALSQQSPGSPIHPIPPSPVLSQLSPAGYCSTRDIVGKAILTIESQGPQQEYFFSFTPILPSQLDKLSLQSSFPREPALSVDLARAPAARNPRKSVKNKPYSPAEEALLVKLKAAGTMDWQEIAQHFQNRSAGALQVHYSTKLKRKAASYRRRRSRSCRKNVL